MKRILTLAAALAVTLPTSGAASARSPIEGRWDNGKMSIRIAPCGDELCGTVIRASEKQKSKARRGSGTDLIGATLIRDIAQVGPNAYKGRVFVADRNIYANGTIRMRGRNQLAVRGCVIGIICKSQTWDRAR